MKEVEEVKEEGRTTGDDDDVLFNFQAPNWDRKRLSLAAGFRALNASCVRAVLQLWFGRA